MLVIFRIMLVVAYSRFEILRIELVSRELFGCGDIFRGNLILCFIHKNATDSSYHVELYDSSDHVLEAP